MESVMTVGELKAILANIHDDMSVLVYDEGYVTEDVSAERCWVKDGETWNTTKPGGVEWTEADGATEYVLIS